MPGIYQIRNIITGVKYIGETARSFPERWQVHRLELDSGRHLNRALQEDWERYGAGAFAFEVIEDMLATATRDERRAREAFYISNTPEHLYNIEFCPRHRRQMPMGYPSADAGEPLLTPQEVAELLRLTDRQVRRMALRREIPAYRVANDWRFRRSEIEAWLAEQRNRPQASEST